MREAPAGIRWLFRLFSAAPERAARGPLYVAASRDLAGVSGKFFKNQRAIDSSAYSRDPRVQRQLWDVSAELVNL
jgi:hypothetical protein